MNVKNCRKCGKMFNYVMGEPLCPQCKEANEAKFQEVKKYVQDNKTAPITAICEDCDVDAKLVKQWIREERLFFADDSPVKINCEKCGCQISTGRYCSKCKKETASGFGNVARRAEAPSEAPASQPGGIKMHTFR